LLKVFSIVFHPLLRPPLDSLFESAERQSTNATEVMSALLNCSGEMLSQLSDEYNSFLVPSAMHDTGSGFYPSSWGMDDVNAQSLYWTVRVLQPRRVVESGVANGRSTRAILLAMKRNGEGELHSFDISNDVGAAVEDELRSRWILHVLPRRRRAQAFQREVSNLTPIDLFLHDSEHTYRWQTMEFRVAWAELRGGGLLASDDVDASFAFQDFARSERVKGFHIVTGRRVFGCIKKGELSTRPT